MPPTRTSCMALMVLFPYWRFVVSHVTFVTCFPQIQTISRDWTWRFLSFENKPMQLPPRPLIKVNCRPILPFAYIMDTSHFQLLLSRLAAMQLSWHTLCLLPRFQLTLTLSVFSIWNMAWKTLDCSQSPIFPLDRRCQSLSLTGHHLGLLMRAKLGRVQNACG